MNEEKLQITLEAARVNAGLTQEEVAKKLEVSRATIISWEKGNKVLKVWELDALCNTYGISRDYIFLPKDSTKGKQ
ncbi:MAG: helix-turn-helix transcriptional regulator [Anaerostipes sp.]|nr:helix-turn-helix transcriptional regulator [Anaerostipes sp.]